MEVCEFELDEGEQEATPCLPSAVPTLVDSSKCEHLITPRMIPRPKHSHACATQTSSSLMSQNSNLLHCWWGLNLLHCWWGLAARDGDRAINSFSYRNSFSTPLIHIFLALKISSNILLLKSLC